MLYVDQKTFYQPKIILCGFIWISLIGEKAYLQIRRMQDPAYFVYENTDPFYLSLKIFEVVMVFLYFVYFLIVSYMVVYSLGMMKKAYKYLILLTLVVITLSILILFLNGRTLQLVNTPLYLSQYVLFNTYMFLVAFFYSPTMDAIPPSRFGQSNIKVAMNSISDMFDRSRSKNDNKGQQTTERANIMNKFYETEMPELTKANIHMESRKAFDQSLGENDDLESFNSTTATTKTTGQRRHLKRTPEDKAKERLWQSIE